MGISEKERPLRVTNESDLENRHRLVRKNVLSNLLRQLVSTICGVLIPRVMIGAFGSVTYGATVSIAQFLSYISLIEGGIGSVARGALYPCLAAGDKKQISGVFRQIQGFFRRIGLVFLLYAAILALFYFDMADITVFSRSYTAGLVIAISLSTLANYMGGISCMTLLHADQKQYLTNTIIMLTNVANTLAIVALVWIKKDILTVKLVSSLVFIVRPFLYAHYVRRDYRLDKKAENKEALKQKWTGIGRHIAYFLHSNTDIVLLTLLADLKYVAVYSVYRLVIKSIRDIASSFSGGMEAAFGAVLARKEKKNFEQMFSSYKAMLTLVSMILFGTTAALLTPFIRLYTGGISDANYIQPVFGLVLLLAEAMDCVALPCYTLSVSANRLKQTKWGAYLEALINISLSCVLIRRNPLLGVAVGTFAATAFKCVYYIVYAGKHFLKASPAALLRKFALTMLLLSSVSVAGMTVFAELVVQNYFVWCLWGCVVFAVISLIALLFSKAVFPQTKLLRILLSR